jgi:hypothetical protein
MHIRFNIDIFKVESNVLFCTLKCEYIFGPLCVLVCVNIQFYLLDD